MCINGECWEIQIVSPRDPILLTSTGRYTIGVCDDNYKTIFISSGLTRQKLHKVLCHEITHAAMFSYNVNMSIEQEEVMADLIATFGTEIIHKANEVFEKMT